MKKILNIFATTILITTGTSSVFSCGHHRNLPATKQQEEDALINFAQQHGIQGDEINKSNWSFQDHPAIDEKEEINFTFEEINNVKDTQHSQLLKEFNGEMTYNLEKMSFNLDGSPFDNPTLIPGYYEPSLHNKPSTITGNANDFTIAAGYDDLRNLSSDLERPDTQTLPKLFAAMDWKNVANFKGLTVPDLESLQKPVWRLLDDEHMALIHVVKTNGTYHIAWTNLDNKKDKKSLFEPDGDISSVFWKDIVADKKNLNTTYYHLWCSQQLVQEITQIYELYAQKPNQNPWFKSDSLNRWLMDRSVKDWNQKIVGVQIINNTWSPYLSYNTSINMLDKALKTLNNASFVQLVNKIPVHYYFQNYDLVFNKDFSFNSAESLKATQEFN